MKIAMTAWMVLALLLVGLSVGRASERDEAIITVQVSSAAGIGSSPGSAAAR